MSLIINDKIKTTPHKIYVGNNVIYGSEDSTHSQAVFQLTSEINGGDEVLIVSTNQDGTAYVLGHSESNIVSDEVTISNGTINASDVDDTSVWTVGNGYTFVNDGYYITYSMGLQLNSRRSQGWTFNPENNYLYRKPFDWGSSFYIKYSNGFYADNNAGSIYLFKKVTE